MMICGLGEASGASEPPSRMTWFIVGFLAALFGGPMLGLGHAGIRRVTKRIEG